MNTPVANSSDKLTSYEINLASFRNSSQVHLPLLARDAIMSKMIYEELVDNPFLSPDLFASTLEKNQNKYKIFSKKSFIFLHGR